MKLNQFKILSLIIVMTASFFSQAEIIKVNLTPGLWEENFIAIINGKNMKELMKQQMDKSLEKMPPEQREQVLKSMKNSGLSGKKLNCLSEAQVNKGFDIDSIKNKMKESGKNCEMTNVSASVKGGKFDVSCNEHGTESKGTGEYTVVSPKEWTYKMTMDGEISKAYGAAMGAGASGKIHAVITSQAKWKKADCGDVKPIEM